MKLELRALKLIILPNTYLVCCKYVLATGGNIASDNHQAVDGWAVADYPVIFTSAQNILKVKQGTRMRIFIKSNNAKRNRKLDAYPSVVLQKMYSRLFNC